MITIVTALTGALLGGVFTMIVSNRKIKAELRASTRLEWIKEVRELTAKIINSYYESKRLYLKAVDIIPPSVNASYDTLQEYKDLSKELVSLSNYITLFKLYFSTIKENEAKVEQANLENINTRNKVQDVKKEATEYKIALDKPYNRKLSVNDDVLDDFQKTTSDYLKREWNRAKRNR